MKICVFGAASSAIDRKYVELTEKLCENMAQRGHELVFGAGAAGLMGAAARGTRKGGGKVTGVIPAFFREETIEAIYEECDELIFTETMRERKMTMEDNADAFIVVPGGIGTFEEFFEVLTLKQLGRHVKPIALYNIDGYFDNLTAFMKHCMEEKFINKSCNSLYLCCDNADELFRYIESDEPLNYSVHELKNN
ncbi:MAG: TIGR00730 family Rossman fold protein [Oscillospiraceae bacterium]|nr:TIGR00730 family Rossman fold protein [Oscillospiraceae bacterium]